MRTNKRCMHACFCDSLMFVSAEILLHVFFYPVTWLSACSRSGTLLRLYCPVHVLLTWCMLHFCVLWRMLQNSSLRHFWLLGFELHWKALPLHAVICSLPDESTERLHTRIVKNSLTCRIFLGAICILNGSYHCFHLILYLAGFTICPSQNSRTFFTWGHSVFDNVLLLSRTVLLSWYALLKPISRWWTDYFLSWSSRFQEAPRRLTRPQCTSPQVVRSELPAFLCVPCPTFTSDVGFFPQWCSSLFVT